ERLAVGVAFGVRDQRHVGERAGRGRVGLFGIAERPAEVASLLHLGDLVGWVVVDVGADDLPERVAVPAGGPVEGVGDFFAVVDRGPDRAVGRHRQPLAIAVGAHHHPHRATARRDRVDHPARRVVAAVGGGGVGGGADVEVDGPVGGDDDVLLAVDVVAGGFFVGQVGGDHPLPPGLAFAPRVGVDLVR